MRTTSAGKAKTTARCNTFDDTIVHADRNLNFDGDGDPYTDRYGECHSFNDGYVHAELKDRRLWQLDSKLAPATAPLVKLPDGVWPMGIVWLDDGP